MTRSVRTARDGAQKKIQTLLKIKAAFANSPKFNLILVIDHQVIQRFHKMEARNNLALNKDSIKKDSGVLRLEDRSKLDDMRFAQGLGASLRYANELRAVQQTGRLPFLKSSRLHEDVLRGKLGPGNGFKDAFGDQEETGPSRIAFV